jgi:RHS repeat-associated protein
MSTNKGTTTGATNYIYLWDAENRLKAIDYPTTNQTTVFSYDGLGRRTKIVESTGSTVTAVRQLIWDGLSIAEQRNSSDSVVKQFFSQGQINSGTPLFYTRDHLGSIREAANASGNLVTRYNYDPYGRRTVVTGADEVDFGFTGHFYHSQSGLHLAPYRAYSADLGRWLSRDPRGELVGVDLFQYSKNAPISDVDPLGLATLQIGFSGNINYSIVNLNGGFGIAVDTSGNVGFYNYFGIGGGLGEEAGGGVSIAVSDAPTIGGLAGQFTNFSTNLGDGISGSVDGFTGTDPCGRPIVGSGITIGGGLGASTSGTFTFTDITPFF